MKTIAKILTGLVIAILLFVGYYVVSSRLSARVQVSVLPAASDENAFRSVAENVKNGQYEGVSSLDAINKYYFVTVQTDVRNYSLFPAEWAQFTVRPADSDALIVSSDAGPADVPSFGSGTFRVTLLTQSDSASRSGWLEYYIFGRLHSLEVAPSVSPES